MTPHQLTLLSAAIEQTKIHKIPIPIDSETVRRLIGISPSALNKAKKAGKLPYRYNISEKSIAIVDFLKQEKRKDYWQVSFQNAD